MTTSLRVLTGIVVLTCLGALPRPARAQGAERTVYVNVFDQSGAPVPALGADYFAIREGGRDREVVRVQPSAVPMHVAVVVDTSAYVESAMDVCRNAISAFVERVAVGNLVAIYEFGNRVNTVVPFTRDGAELKDGIGRLVVRANSVPRLVDAVEQAARDLRRAEARRPVIVALTVGANDGSERSAGSVIKVLIEQSVSLYAVELDSATASALSASGGSEIDRLGRLKQLSASGEASRERAQMVEQGTALTAGSLQKVAAAMAFGPAMDRIRADLEAAYALTFDRPGSGKLKDLQVGVMLQDVVVRAIAAPTAAK
ncbi:MAG: VWA domain-containing protein [Acidobacteria bacterium]|nr:VWA domain-containing protein [Acidobacteriota bacterium]